MTSQKNTSSEHTKGSNYVVLALCFLATMTEASSCQWQKLATSFPAAGSVAEQWQSIKNLDTQFFDGNQKTCKIPSSETTNSTRVTRSSTSTVTVDFEKMIVRETQEKIRRLSTLERPQKMYQFEQEDIPSNWWDDFDCDCCELIRMAEEAGRTKFFLYIGFDNTAHEINLTRKTILNLTTGEVGMIRQTPRATFSASSAAITPAVQSLSLSSSNVMTQSSVDESASVVISSSVEVMSFGSEDVCAICLDHFDPSKSEQKGFQLRECGPHFFHSACILKQLVRAGKCPVCSKHYIVATGNQPLGGKMNVVTYPANGHYQLAGYPDVGTIFITYSIPSGIQGPDHPHPGVPFSGTHRHAYLPDNDEGREVLGLLQVCFQRRMTFTVGRSLTTGCDNVVTWNGVHHKTNTSGGPAYFGFPDDGYFFRVKEELKAKGIGIV